MPQANKKLAQVAIVGRANVGKSMLFNRLIEENKALVSPISGTTRDRNIDTVTWRDREFTLVDTGGLDIDESSATLIEKGIVTQAEQAIADSALIFFVIDAKTGVLPDDKDLARSLRQRGYADKIILVANKADSLRWHQKPKEMYGLALGEPQMISAASGSGCGDLLDIVLERLPRRVSKIKEVQKSIRIAIVGKPNVGKSALVNAMLGEERVIVSPIAHTTRESHDTPFRFKDTDFVLIDTAGIRRRGQLTPGSLERLSVDKSLATIVNADIILFVTDASLPLDAQDKKITQAVLEAGKPIIIIGNKWDLIPEKDTATINKFEEYYRGQMPYLWWAPLIFISASELQRTHKVLDLSLTIHAAMQLEATQGQLDFFLKRSIKQQPPSRGKGLKNPFIYQIRQIKTNPPRFQLVVNDPKILHFSYLRFIQNGIREHFKLIGCPIQMEMIKKSKLK